MKRIFLTIAGSAALAAGGLLAHALEGENGTTATQLFTADAVRAAVVYDASFAGAEWGDLASFGLGGESAYGDAVSLDADGNLYCLVYGSNQTDTSYTGMVRFDGSTFEHVVQEAWTYPDAEGAYIKSLAVSPVTAGLLTAGQPVYLRHSTVVWGAELVAVDPEASPPTTTVLHCFPAPADGGPIPERFDIAADGSIYAIHPGDDSIRKLVYDAGTEAYTESTVNTAFAAGSSLRVGSDGALYAFSASQDWVYATKAPKTIHRIDPVTGAATYFAEVPGWTFVFDWDWATDGRLWIGLRSSKSRLRYVTEVVEGRATSTRSAIATLDHDPHSVAAGPEASVRVMERVPIDGVDRPYDNVWELVPGSGGGGGGGGGNGKPPKKK